MPDSAETLNNLGYLMERLGRLDEAIVNYQKAVEIKPELPEAHANLGNVLASRGRIGEAMAQYREALEVATRYNNRALAEAMRARIARCEAGSLLPQPQPTAVQRPPKP
jgi:tetratricopeptide (TPR) repeat protein